MRWRICVDGGDADVVVDWMVVMVMASRERWVDGLVLRCECRCGGR